MDTLNYKLLYGALFGGVVSLSAKDYAAVNGFSNQFWGWGGEDDEFAKRIASRKWNLRRDSKETGRYG